MVVRRSLPAWVLGGGYGVVDLGDAEVVVVESALPSGASTHGWVDLDARCCRVLVVSGGMCVRRPSGCWLVVLWTFCPWWPLSPDNPLLGARYLRRETSNRICAAVVSICGLFLLRHCCGLGGVFLTMGGLPG